MVSIDAESSGHNAFGERRDYPISGCGLGISEIMMKAHRGQVMRKMKAESLPALVHMAARLGVATETKTFC
jgi:hypothetical protein